MKKSILIIILILVISLVVALYLFYKNSDPTVSIGKHTVTVTDIETISENEDYIKFIDEVEQEIISEVSSSCVQTNIVLNNQLEKVDNNVYKVTFHGECTTANNQNDFEIIVNDTLMISEYNIIPGNNNITFTYDNTLEIQEPTNTVIEVGSINQDTTEEDYKIATSPSSLTAVINKVRRLPSDYVPANLTSITVSSNHSGDNNLIRADILPYIEQMFNDASVENINLVITSAYRSYVTQEQLFNNYVAADSYENAIKYSAFPGASEHQTGLAIDIGEINGQFDNFSTEFGEGNAGIWLANNAHKYGFILRYPLGSEEITTYQYEPWHFRFVGVELATYIYDSNLTMEEFFQVY